MKLTKNPKRLWGICGSTILPCLCWALSAHAVPNPEQDTLLLSRRLKPIPDETWKSVAGARLSENYTIEKGDTLWDISKRLFGDGSYWPKLWALNNNSITNPHQIRPGRAISFMPGSGTSLPQLAIRDTLPSSASAVAEAPQPPQETLTLSDTGGNLPRSHEWKQLPKQNWETVTVRLPPGVDAYGFQKNPRRYSEALNGFELEKVAFSESIDPVGRITGSAAESAVLSMGDLIFIRATEGPLQIGQTYSLVENPEKVSAGGRSAYTYPLLGDVRIERIEGNQTIGRITRSKGISSRDAFLIPFVPRAKILNPIPGPEGVQGRLAIDRYFTIYATVQHATSFVNRGSEDGIHPGMVFRAYLHRDPVTDKKLTSSDVIDYADFLVAHVSQRYCTVIGISTKSTVDEDTDVVLLTDVSSLIRGNQQRTKEIESKEAIVPGPVKNDELDSLEGNEHLGDEEKKELQQLEEWKGNPPPVEEVPPPPAEEVPPPPAEEVPPPPAEAEPQTAPVPEVTPEPAPTPEATTLPSVEPELPSPPPPAPEGFEPPKPTGSATPEDF